LRVFMGETIVQGWGRGQMELGNFLAGRLTLTDRGSVSFLAL
jgi:hypothetical protein